MKWTLLIKALLEGCCDGARYKQDQKRRERERDCRAGKKKHFHSQHEQLHADKPRTPRPTLEAEPFCPLQYL